MQYKLSTKLEKTTKTGKPYTSATLTDEAGKEYFAVNAFNGEFSADVWHGELEKNGNYWNLITPKKASTFTGGAFKSAQIEKAMDKKADQIAKAQDRSAWMWAKTNASTILAPNYAINGRPPVNVIADEVIRLATLIYNGEPTEPFSSPVRPSTELSGKDKLNQESAERLFDEGLTEEELVDLDDIPF